MTSKPRVRRKSSASTLLSSFSKSTNVSPSPSVITAPFTTQPTHQSSVFHQPQSASIDSSDGCSPSIHSHEGGGFPFHTAGSTRNGDTPVYSGGGGGGSGSSLGGARVTSMGVRVPSGSVGSLRMGGREGGSGSLPPTGNGGGLIVNGPESLTALIDKRTASWWYLRRAHEGQELWFNTVRISQSDIERHLDATLGQTKIRQRCRQFFILGLSLSPLFDIHSAPDALRRLVKIIDEWEAWAEGDGGRGMKTLFRNQKGRKSSNAPNHAGLSYVDMGESNLMMINLPFTPDYFQIIISLCEIIRQFYIKLSVLIDPASMENSIAPRPDSAAPYGSVNGRRGVARQSAGVPSFSGSISPPVLDGASPRTPIYRKIPAEAPQWSPGLGELIMNADGKFKKILAVLTREMEMVAKHTATAELSSLLPSLSGNNQVGQSNIVES